jgi:hypothetical protein
MQFTMVPQVWLDQLRCAGNATFRLAIALLRLNYKHANHAFRLTNPALEGLGVATRSKWRGLEELERLGLVSITRQRLKSSPTVKVRHASNLFMRKEGRKAGRKAGRKKEEVSKKDIKKKRRDA